MRASVNTATGRATIYQDEQGVHLRILETTGTIWEAGFFPAEKWDDLPQAWQSALSLAREIISPNFGTRH
ncbi:hypothetical protein [Acidithiobacillus thiooxidans]|uniref:Uncharacterized protein n=1 Tax=Acidithiobacillus thiooxidans TaxID=930 RepID=A0A1C2I1M1_ACITH|nr:hypothetical protein [Acidithiobacillus thiooxidans]OCX69884.1 hypothetical protein A6M23_14685 [Acidithiobacillus thiooxidans]OCX77910.1 hypothetical protein A6P08_20530 [Acidithiobacillus thiooxidans]